MGITSGTSFQDGVDGIGGANAISLPYNYLIGPRGKALFVAPFRTGSGSGTNTGASDGNVGSLTAPLKTVARAYELCDGDKGEVIYILGYENAAAEVTDDFSAKFTWAKNSVHLIGLVPPVRFSHRVRLNQLSTATSVSPLLDVTGNNNVFANFQIFQGVANAASLVCVRVTGVRNYFENVHIAGIGNATQVASGAASLKLDGASECVFKNCTIGLDTITRDQNCREIWFDTDVSRVLFEDCLINAFISNSGYAHVKVNDATGVDRGIYFKNCLFMSKSANKATTQTSVFDIPAISQGAIVLENSHAFSDGGAVAWDSNSRGIVWNTTPAAAAAGAGGVLTNL